MSDPLYLVGESARIHVRVADISGAVIDPVSLVLRVKTAGGAVTAYTYGMNAEVVRESTGIYHADIALPTAGQWSYRWEVAAPNAGVAEGSINVQKSRVI